MCAFNAPPPAPSSPLHMLFSFLFSVQVARTTQPLSSGAVRQRAQGLREGSGQSGKGTRTEKVLRGVKDGEPATEGTQVSPHSCQGRGAKREQSNKREKKAALGSEGNWVRIQCLLHARHLFKLLINFAFLPKEQLGREWQKSGKTSAREDPVIGSHLRNGTIF